MLTPPDSVWGERPVRLIAFFVQMPKADAERMGGISDCLSRITRGGSKVMDFGIGTADSKNHYWLEVMNYCEGSSDFLQHLSSIGISRDTVAECREIPPGTGRDMAQQRSLFA